MPRRPDGKLHLDRVVVRYEDGRYVAERSGAQASNALAAWRSRTVSRCCPTATAPRPATPSASCSWTERGPATPVPLEPVTDVGVPGV